MVTLRTVKKEPNVGKVVLVRNSPLIKTATSISSSIVNSLLIKSPKTLTTKSTTTSTFTATTTTTATTVTTAKTTTTGTTTTTAVTTSTTTISSSNVQSQSNSPSNKLVTNQCENVSSNKFPTHFCAILDDFINKFSSDPGQKLTCLNLSFCSLKTIPHQISKLSCLKNLNLSCNELINASFPHPNDTIESLALSFNQIVINEATLREINTTFSRLVKLNLSYNLNGDSRNLRLRIDFSSDKG
ncbi:bypass of stop codon protein 1-like [Tetranychus urticae]|uniref:bypass of stop codon protein 1-like n=1 Tax=Tetranychus urticae TaxID=32264 RepID=UPI000D654394|nr:bypass of stop codon protein 1-like [Tetranychus urticae]